MLNYGDLTTKQLTNQQLLKAPKLKSYEEQKETYFKLDKRSKYNRVKKLISNNTVRNSHLKNLMNKSARAKDKINDMVKAASNKKLLVNNSCLDSSLNRNITNKSKKKYKEVSHSKERSTYLIN